jgi:hypothetical protein
MDTKLIARYAIRETMGIVVMGVALFWSAGRIDWWPAWASIAVMLAWITATAIVIFRLNPDLLAERLGPRVERNPVHPPHSSRRPHLTGRAGWLC